jgi:hypothetical protein
LVDVVARGHSDCGHGMGMIAVCLGLGWIVVGGLVRNVGIRRREKVGGEVRRAR